MAPPTISYRMPPRWQDWVHVTKLDPDKRLSPEAIAEIAASGTDALMLSGTLNVTRENLAELRRQVADYDLPLVVEPAGPEGVLVDGIDLLFVPSVMNTTDVRWIVGTHHAWILEAMQHEPFRQEPVPWEKVVQEAYIVLNPDSAVGRVTGARCPLSPESAAAYATVADRYFCFPIVYVEVQRHLRRPGGREGRPGRDRPGRPLLRRRDPDGRAGGRDGEVRGHGRGRQRRVPRPDPRC